MLCLSSGRSLLSRGLCLQPSACSAPMYATRLYNSPAAGAGGGGGAAQGAVKQGRRSLTMIEGPHLTALAHPQHSGPPASAYHLYQGRPFDTQRGTHFHYHPPHLPPHYQHQVHFHSHGGGGAAGPSVAAAGKKKAWNFIHEKMSYDTFFTMKRLIERSRRPDEVLRWVTQNPAKISYNHYPVALQKIGQLLQAAPAPRPPSREESEAGSKVPLGVDHQVLEQQDFQTLCDAIVTNCPQLDNFSIVNCLYATASLGLPSDSQLVQVLEAECQSRLNQFNQKDVSMVFSSSMKLHPGVQHPLTEACLACLEKNLERERHPQTLFMLLSYYRLKWHSLQHRESAIGGGDTPLNPEQLLANRKILRLVKHTLASISGVRDQEMALLDEMLATCAREASNKSLELIFSSHLFYQNRQEKFISSLAEELPKKSDGISPYTMALIAKYIARHRLRETQLLDTIAEFLVKKAEFLDSKVIQKLVFPFSRMSYRPSNQQQFFRRLEEVLELKALSSPLATVNILMSLFQLGHFPGPVLHRVFSSTFISNVTNGPYALIVRRYLSLLDAAVGLENQNYTGPRLQNNHKVLMFDHALTADEVNRKYSYKGLVAEALRQLVGEENYKQDQVLAPGYYTDFLLWLDPSNRVLPIRPGPGDVVPGPTPADGTVAVLTSEFRHFSPFAEEDPRRPCPVAETAGGAAEPLPFLPHHICSSTVPSGPPRSGTDGAHLDYGQYYMPAPQYYPSLAKEHSLESQDSSTLSSPPSEGLAPPPSSGPGPTTTSDSLFQFSIGKILEDEGHSGAPEGGAPDRGLPGFYDTVAGTEGSGVDTETPTAPPPEPPEPDPGALDQRAVRKVVVSVNDKWHYCHNSDVLVGSRAMRDRHLRLLGYVVLQLPYQDLEKLNGIEEVKSYLQEKLTEVTMLR